MSNEEAVVVALRSLADDIEDGRVGVDSVKDQRKVMRGGLVVSREYGTLRVRWLERKKP